MGTYVGELSGNATGALIINIKKSGSVEVTKTFSGNSETFLQGIVFEGGALEKVSSPSTGFTLYGNLNSKGGTWKQGSWSGSWSVRKNKHNKTASTGAVLYLISYFHFTFCLLAFR